MEKRKIIIGWATTNETQAHDLESFNRVLDDPERNEGVLLARNEKDPEKKKWLKTRQPGVMWNVDGCIDNIRSSQNAIPSPFYYTDVDKKDNPHMGDPRDYFFKNIWPHREVLRLVWAQISTSQGLHTACQRPQNATIAQAQKWQSSITGLNHDPACHNEDRVTFLGRADEVLHFDKEALFGMKELEPYTIDIPSEDALDGKKGEDTVITQEMIEEVRNSEKYGVKSGDIFDGVVGTEMIPEGHRNTVVFAKAHKLMAAGFTQKELVILFSSVTNLSQAELNQACRWQPNYVPANGKLPNDLRRIVRQLREEKGLVTGEGLLPCRPLPRKLPPLFAVLAAIAPASLRIPLLILSLPILGAIATRVRFTYLDGVIHTLAFIAHVVGQFAGGKSTIIRWLTEHLLTAIREHDAVGRQAEREYVEAMKKCKADDRKPDDPKPVIREVPITISIAALLKRFDQSQGQHLISVCDEVDTLRNTNRAGAWSDKTVIYRQAFDTGEVGQDFLSENSYSGIFTAAYNMVTGGTEESTRNFYGPHVMDGLVSRVAFTRIESDSFAEEMPRLKPLSVKQKVAIEEGIHTLEAAEGEVRTPRIDKAIEGWLAEKRTLAMETMSFAINAMYKRAAVMGKRSGVIAYILCGYRETNVVVDFALWVADYILQQQVAMWGGHFENEDNGGSTTPVANLFQELPDEFTKEELVNLRSINGQGTNVRMILKRWRDRGMICETDKNRYAKLGINKQA